MAEIGMHEAKTQLSQLVERAQRGEEIIITRHGTPAVRLTPVPRGNRLASVYGLFMNSPSVVDEHFDELPADIAEALGMDP